MSTPSIALDSKLYNILDKTWRDQNLAWQPYSSDGRSNVEIVRLYDDKTDGVGPAGALLRYAPGASVPAHLHPGTEVILVLEGELINDAGVHGPGTLEICPPGSVHTLSSRIGCTFLVIWEQPVERLGQVAA
ncbi:cupin domain-containing protein [Pseudomonas sp. nanlin1]|uniref:cupin domain-containing protein n=1 Tax=Pseudomonas sp. nanlin1 TaxID=3040605 RepID=UPI00388F03F5